ncbi:glutathione-S-transferase [Cyathus striatus]|nr:glutathione-S-transferase [Cyathus striatus]
MPIPNHLLHPRATGEAEKLVAAHQDTQELVFYAGWFCPYVQRSWITLEEKGIPYQYKEVNPYKKEPHFLAINPKGLVPAVEYGGKAIYESLIICEFLEDAYPEYKPHLLPDQAIDKAIARIWVDFVGKSVIPPIQRLIPTKEKENQDAERTLLYNALKAFSDQIKGPYFFGEKFSIVDVAISPWIVRDYILVEHRGCKREDVGEKWVKYAAEIEKRDSVVKTSSLKEHLTKIYSQHF